MKSTTVDDGTPAKTAESRQIERALARCLADLEARGDYAAPYDRAADVRPGEFAVRPGEFAPSDDRRAVVRFRQRSDGCAS